MFGRSEGIIEEKEQQILTYSEDIFYLYKCLQHDFPTLTMKELYDNLDICIHNLVVAEIFKKLKEKEIKQEEWSESRWVRDPKDWG